MNIAYPEQHDLRKNQRVYMRSLFPKDKIITFRISGEPLRKAVLHSISQAGLFIKCDTKPRENAELSMIFEFAGQNIQCQGRVIYQNNEDELNTPGFGVKFTRMLKEDYQAIDLALRDLMNDMTY